ncbi:very short patch repair endonuclease [Bacteroides thetaiotaomicron]|uniref:very short patch repair endonuclease n=1 Tax=Bacteroides thetaiotaomicron TaxID=818 RepID=UPI001CE31390|nr:DNA mismatch endonuclease Vsr [Bacteroides thetaiotaomicron]MCA6010802.1 DNA mismatch endonuclease Vsr [Bacteroides thetaiotaomicron]
MADKFSKEKRSDIMSKITGKETKPEILVRRFLFAAGFRFRKNVVNLLGKPDIVLSKYNTIIFVHGCFWHGHTCKRGKLPESNHEFWKQKIEKNIERDKQIIAQLEKDGWTVIIIWQCEIRNKEKCNMRLNELIDELKIDIKNERVKK